MPTIYNKLIEEYKDELNDSYDFDDAECYSSPEEEYNPSPFAINSKSQYVEISEMDAASRLDYIQQEYNQLDQDEKNIFIARLQLNSIDKLLNAIKEGKKTTKETWKNVLNRLNFIKGFKAIYEDEIKSINFQSIIQALIPLAGALAATFLALKESDKKESESAEPEENELLTEDLLKLENVNERNKEKSLIIQYCNENKNGFSLNGQQ